MKLRNKITVGALAFLLLALFLCCFLFMSASKKVMLENTINYTQQEEEKLVANIRTHASEIEAMTSDLTAEAGLKYFFSREVQSAAHGSEYILQSGSEVLFNNTGIDAVSALNLEERSLYADCETRILSFGEETYCLSGKTITLRGKDYQICVVKNISDLFEKIRNQIFLCAGIGLAVLILTGGFMAFFLKKVLCPLEHLQEETKAIASGQYDRRVEVSGKDELAALADSFNVMVQSVKEHIEEVEATSEARNQLIHALAHEMRTPVTAICGYAYALRSVRMNDEQKDEAVEFIDQESRRLERLSGKLTTLVGLSSGPFEKKAIALDDWKTELEKIFAGRKDITITVEPGEQIQGDPDLLTMLLTNLCDNAKKAGATVIELSLRRDRIQVKDNGSGIPGEQLDMIFDEFYQGNASRNQEGFGLGLSLCQKIARLHGAELKVESEEGKGSCFFLCPE